jgi:hypothetical protein
MNLILRNTLLILAALSLGAGAAVAAKKEKDSAAKPELIGTFGDWKVFHSGAGKARICYLLAEPKSRAPEGEKQEKAYAFISERPAEKVRNELSFVMGFEVGAAIAAEPKEKEKDKKKPKRARKDDEPAPAASGPTAAVGDQAFDLIPRGNDLWVKNPAEETKVIDEMRKGASLVIKASSRRGKKTTDTYSLSGFGQAVDKALKDCAG